MKMSCFMEMYGKVCRGYINILVNISEPDNDDERWGLWYEEGCVQAVATGGRGGAQPPLEKCEPPPRLRCPFCRNYRY